MAKDQVTRQSWWKDKAFSHVSRLAGMEINQDSFARVKSNFPSDQYFQEADLYYRNPPNGFAFFHRAVKVKGNHHYYM